MQLALLSLKNQYTRWRKGNSIFKKCKNV
jgi:hypothetical protein